jgi:hypothetical protein
MAHDSPGWKTGRLPLPPRVVSRLEVGDRPVIIGCSDSDLGEHVLVPDPVRPRDRVADGVAW